MVRAEGGPRARGCHLPAVERPRAGWGGMPRGAERAFPRSRPSGSTKSRVPERGRGSSECLRTGCRAGRLTLSPMLNDEGADRRFHRRQCRLRTLFPVRLRRCRAIPRRWFEAHLPPAGVAIRALCASNCWASGIAGRKSRELLRPRLPRGHRTRRCRFCRLLTRGCDGSGARRRISFTA